VEGFEAVMIYELFTRSMALPSADREAYLRLQCTDENVLAQVLSLLSTASDEFTLSNDLARESDLYHDNILVDVGDFVSVYQLTQNLGRGGMGAVFKALRVDGAFEQTVAIKIISPQLYGFLDSNKLTNEANFMAKLNHSNICTVHDAGITEGGLHYIVMEYIDGSEISTYFTNPTITFNKKLAVYSDLCDAVNYAHKMQVIHGDLKPANIIITENIKIKVLDFGISQMISNQHFSLGTEEDLHFHAMTKGYASPEVIAGEKPSIYSDIFALGRILANLIEQDLRGRHANYKEIMAIAAKAGAFYPVERYSSVSELKNDITRFLTGHVALAYQGSNFYKIKKFVLNRHPISTLVSFLFTISLSILVANLIIQQHELESEKYQTDLMLEKFSLVLDLDFDSKSDVEMSLANNYMSRGEYDKATAMYQKIINRFDELTNTDVAFKAGIGLIKLLIKLKVYDSIPVLLSSLKDRLVYLPNSPLPITATQAMFYHYFIDSTYNRSVNNSEVFLFHTQLMQDIKNEYWRVLTEQQKVELNFSMLIESNKPKETRLPRDSFYYQSNNFNKEEDLLDSVSVKFSIFTGYLDKFIDRQLTIDSQFTPKENEVIAFLESGPVYVGSTHKSKLDLDHTIKAIFSRGIIEIKDHKGIYAVNKDELSMDFGEGAGSDMVIYVTPELALSVPINDHDLILLTKNDLLNNDNLSWSRSELLENTWYHIYDSSTDPDDAVKPTIMQMKFEASAAKLTSSGGATFVAWDIENSLLQISFSEKEPEVVRLHKSLSGAEIIVVKNIDTNVFSLFVKNNDLAQYIFQRWYSLS
jgi:serine/threonine protein kinase